MQLSEEQKNIVDKWTTDGGAILVSASAGSGKTRIITESVKHLLEKEKKENFRILCLTFTNKASEEMKERLKSVRGVKERTFIDTIHAFGLEVIQAYRYELGYIKMPHIIEKETDRIEILKKVFLQTPILTPYFEERLAEHGSQKKLLSKSLNWISKQKKKLIFIDDEVTHYDSWEVRHLQLYKQYNQFLKNQNLIEFDDILLLAWKLLSIQNVASIYQTLYRYILIDEGQDLNFAQYQILKTLCGSSISNILIVGDGKQAIHGYTGAKKEYMFTNFVHDFSAVKYNIQYNYRSSKAVLHIANNIIKTNPTTPQSPQFFEGTAKIHSFIDEEAEANWILEKIQQLQKDNLEEFNGALSLDRVAILARNRFVFSELIKKLETEKISYVLRKGSDNFQSESKLFRVFNLGLRILTNPHGEIYRDQLSKILEIDIPFKKINNDTEFLQLMNAKVLKLPKRSLYDAWTLINKNISNFSKALDLIECDLKNESDNERNYAQRDLYELREYWKSYLYNTAANSKSLSSFLRYIIMGFNKPLNTAEKQLTLATVHTTKGLEFDVVFLMGMTEGTFPDYRSTTDIGLEEERNNAYVAVTRARRHIYITFPEKKMMPWGSEKIQEKSRFIEKLKIEPL